MMTEYKIEINKIFTYNFPRYDIANDIVIWNDSRYNKKSKSLEDNMQSYFCYLSKIESEIYKYLSDKNYAKIKNTFYLHKDKFLNRYNKICYLKKCKTQKILL